MAGLFTKTSPASPLKAPPNTAIVVVQYYAVAVARFLSSLGATASTARGVRALGAKRKRPSDLELNTLQPARLLLGGPD